MEQQYNDTETSLHRNAECFNVSTCSAILVAAAGWAALVLALLTAVVIS